MNQQQAPFDVRDIMTPDSSEARMHLLVRPWSIVMIALLGFLVVELLVGHLYLLTDDVHPEKGYEVITLPTGETHYFQEKPFSIGFVRPRAPFYGVIWRELKRLY